MTGPDLATRQAVIERAGKRCERCGLPGAQIHHRKPRQMGGTSDPAINAFPNLVLVCVTCHDEIERNRQMAYESGWLVHRWDDPAQVPALTLEGFEIHFNPDGTVARGFIPRGLTPPF